MKRLKIFLIFLVLIAFFSFPLYLAQAISFWDVGTTLGLGTADLQETAIAIIQWILGLLGIIGVAFVLYGGFLWLTSAGNEDKIERAKKVITAAVIGLVIVLLSWAIIQFAVRTLTNVSGVS